MKVALTTKQRQKTIGVQTIIGGFTAAHLETRDIDFAQGDDALVMAWRIGSHKVFLEDLLAEAKIGPDSRFLQRETLGST